jgi:flagellar hook assembly protein FlgD
LRIEAQPRTTQAALLTAVSAQAATGGVEVVYSMTAAAQVQIEVVNIAGRKIATILGGYQSAGMHTAQWAGRNDGGTKVPPGQYLLTVQCTGEDGTRNSRIVTVGIR